MNIILNILNIQHQEFVQENLENCITSLANDAQKIIYH